VDRLSVGAGTCGAVDASRELRAAAGDIEVLRLVFAPERREPPLGWPGLEAWESQHGVVLPEPYRTFAAEIANGCSLRQPSDEGPLLPLGRLPENWHRWDSKNWLSPELFDSWAPRDPCAPFPLAEEWQWEYDFDPDEHVALMSSLYRDGSLILGAEETGSYWALITAGPQRGNIWLLADGCAFPYVGPDRDSVHPLGFLEWVKQRHTGRGWWDEA
jgi:hypothetical protein